MNATALAEELISLRAELNHQPAGEALTELSGGEYFALTLLLRRESAAHPSELSRIMQVSTARVAAMLRHLEGRGWIVREHDRDDERRVSVRLTDAGRVLIEERRSAALACVAELFSALEPEEAREYLRLKRKLLTAAQQARRTEQR